MKRVLLAKFRQNIYLLDLLQKTGDRRLEDASPGDAYWGAGVRGKGRNRMGALLEEVRAELKDIRVDAEALDAAPPPMIAEDAGENLAGIEDEPENLAAAAQEIVAEATGGVVRLAPAETGSEVSVEKEGSGEAAIAENKAPQSGGVYLFINPSMRENSSEARHARSRSQRRGRVTWAEQNGGGADSFGDHDAAAGASGATEVTVQKME